MLETLLNIPFKKVVLPGRVKCGGTEGEIVVAHGCRKTKKLICGKERGNSGGSWLPENKKANMWHRRGNSGGAWPPAYPCSYTTYLITNDFIAKWWRVEGEWEELF